jgi:hypothetical protein
MNQGQLTTELRAYAVRLIHQEVPMTTYTDEYIEHWAAVFAAQRLNFTLGITFDEFLERPEEFRRAGELAATADRLAAGNFDPLLPRQLRVRLDLIEAEARAERPAVPLDGIEVEWIAERRLHRGEQLPPGTGVPPGTGRAAP